VQCADAGINLSTSCDHSLWRLGERDCESVADARWQNMSLDCWESLRQQSALF